MQVVLEKVQVFQKSFFGLQWLLKLIVARKRFDFLLDNLIVHRGLGLDNELIISTHEPASLLSLSWDGEVNMSRTQAFTDMELDQGTIEGLAFMTRASDLFGWVSTSGQAWLAQRFIKTLVIILF